MNPLISILIPAYQAEKTIHRCLSSILNQTNHDFEVIIIDDGSKDRTFSICLEYQNDKRFKIYTQTNQGVAATRQRLLALANGRYIQFVDADDWVDLNMVEKYYSILKRCDYDIIISDYIYHSSHTIQYKQQKPSSLTPQCLIRDISSPKLLGVLWNKLIKRNLISKVHVPNLRYCEDWCICVSLFQEAKNIKYTNVAFYHYDNTNTTNSLTRNITRNSFRYRMQYIDYLQTIGFDKLYPKEYDSQVANIAYAALVYNIYTDNEFHDTFRNISLFFNYNTLYKRIILILTSIFPLLFVRTIDTTIRKIINKLQSVKHE